MEVDVCLLWRGNSNTGSTKLRDPDRFDLFSDFRVFRLRHFITSPSKPNGNYAQRKAYNIALLVFQKVEGIVANCDLGVVFNPEVDFLERRLSDVA